ncbi:P-loop containing nucleoside triphosphate hydrolase protein [Xylaria curta]|nr:P-loop containing nucleoside triphosphate hydrolase protein [Xylaria curta]
MDCNSEPRCHSIIFILGPPGSGKGTLCKFATDRLKTPDHRYLHLSVGDYLRELCDPAASCEVKGFNHDEIRENLQESKLLPADVLIPVLEHKINSTPKEKNVMTTWLIDGFPRNMETALAFEEKVDKPVKIIALNCKREIAQERFLGRSREATDDVKRFDKRYGEYVENTKKIGDYYAGLTDTIYVNGDRGECLEKFMVVLRQGL